MDTIRTAEMIARIDIARVTGLSQALVTGLTAEMIKEGLIIEKKNRCIRGRQTPNANGLEFRMEAYVAGVNLAIDEISVVIVNFTASVVADWVEPLEPVWGIRQRI